MVAQKNTKKPVCVWGGGGCGVRARQSGWQQRAARRPATNYAPATPHTKALTDEDGDRVVQSNGHHKHAVVEHGRELAVRERQRPQPQVGGRVGDRAQHKLDGVDHLVHHHLAKIKVVPMAVAAAACDKERARTRAWRH
jgi:hypothetical protein